MTARPLAEEPLRGGASLPLSWRLAILAVVVTQFLFAHGPVWKHLFHWDWAIFSSYLSIPLLVLVALAIRRQLRLGPLVIDTLQIAFIKFGITASILTVILLVSPAPPPDSHTVFLPVAPPAAAPPLPPPVLRPPPPPEATFEVRGRVVDAGGAPQPGAVVYLEGRDLEAIDYGVAAGEVTLRNDGGGMEPALVLARLGQRVTMRSTNAQLHTILLRGLGSAPRLPVSLPVLPSGVPTDLPLDRGTAGLFAIECTVHRAREGQAFVLFSSHPFVQQAGADGEFAFERVPAAGEGLVLHAFRPGSRVATMPLRPSPRQSVEALVTLQPGR